MNTNSEKTRGGRRIVIMLMLAAFSLALFSTPVSALSHNPKNSLTRPWSYNSDGGDEGGWGGEQKSMKQPRPQIPFVLTFMFDRVVLPVSLFIDERLNKKPASHRINNVKVTPTSRTAFSR